MVPTVTATISTIWKNEPMKITSSFCVSPMPAHRMQQRYERGRRQIARERHERLEECLDRLVRAHRDAERHRQRSAASTKPPKTRQTVMPMSVANPCTVNSASALRAAIVTGSARNVFDTKPPKRRDAPDGGEYDEKRDAVSDLAPRADRDERRHATRGRRACTARIVT